MFFKEINYLISFVSKYHEMFKLWHVKQIIKYMYSQIQICILSLNTINVKNKNDSTIKYKKYNYRNINRMAKFK